MAEKVKAKRVAFGGYGISFAGRQETLQDIFGKERIAPSQMTRVMWQFIKKNQLGGK